MPSGAGWADGEGGRDICFVIKGLWGGGQSAAGSDGSTDYGDTMLHSAGRLQPIAPHAASRQYGFMFEGG